MTDLPDRLVRERNRIRNVLGRRWKAAALLSSGRLLLDYGCLLATIRATGAKPNPSLVLLAYAVAKLLALIPITPGGLGLVEAGLSGLLILAGVPGGDAVVATLAYRIISYWLPIFVGPFAYLRLPPALREAGPPTERGSRRHRAGTRRRLIGVNAADVRPDASIVPDGPPTEAREPRLVLLSVRLWRRLRDRLGRSRPPLPPSQGLPPDHVLERFSWSEVIDEIAVEGFGNSTESRELDRFPRLGLLELAHPLLGDSHPQ